jgi:branched-chain amino acid transport system permease protein
MPDSSLHETRLSDTEASAVEILILGATRGALYALVAVGFVLVFSVGGILNLAHGTLFMLGAYFTYIYYSNLFDQVGQAQLIASMLLAVLSTSVVALFLYRVVYRRRIESISYVMVISLAVALFVGEVMSLLYGVTGTAVPPLARGSQDILGVRILNQELLLLPVSLTALIGLWLFLKGTRMGKAVEAVAQNQQGAILVGVNTNVVLGATIAISGALAAIAGALVSSLVTVVPSMWVYWLIKAFAIAIVGGLGSVPGAIMAAFIVSYAEVATIFATSEQFADLVALMIIVTILIFKPTGLLGKKV